MIQWMLTIWSLVPLSFLNPACIYGSSLFTYCYSLAWRILSIILLTCEMSEMNATMWQFEHCHCLSLGLEWKLSFYSPLVFQIWWHIECEPSKSQAFFLFISVSWGHLYQLLHRGFLHQELLEEHSVEGISRLQESFSGFSRNSLSLLLPFFFYFIIFVYSLQVFFKNSSSCIADSGMNSFNSSHLWHVRKVFIGRGEFI